MAKEEYVRDESGNITHIRVTSDDGRTSYLYKANDSVSALVIGAKGELVEVAEHNEDGTTVAHKADNSVSGWLLRGARGERK